MSVELALLKRALLSVDHKAVLEEVRRQADQIRAAMEIGDVEFSDDEIVHLGRHPAWTAEVYSALAGPQESQVEESEITKAIAALRAQGDKEIAQAFVMGLESLDPRFHDWGRWFKGVPRISGPFRDYLLKDRAVSKAGKYSLGLAAYGLTPTVFMEATRGVELLCNRIIRDASSEDTTLSKGAPFSQELNGLHMRIRSQVQSGARASLDVVLPGGPATAAPLPYPLLLAQIKSTPQCPPEAAEPLLTWIVDVTQLRPFLIRSYQAETLGEHAIRLTHQPEPETVGDLVLRWSRVAQDKTKTQPKPARV
jgi:hypothetical protein